MAHGQDGAATGAMETQMQQNDPQQQQHQRSPFRPQPPTEIKHADSSSSVEREPPPPPVPASDPRLEADAKDEDDEPAPPPNVHDLFKLPSIEALKLLSASIELLVRLTGDIPPTPPPQNPTDPQMSDLQTEKANIARSHSERDLARARRTAEDGEGLEERRRRRKREAEAERMNKAQRDAKGTSPRGIDNQGVSKFQAYSAALSAQLMAQQRLLSPPSSSIASISAQATPAPIDGVQLKTDTAAAMSPPPEADAKSEPEPYIVIGADSQPLNLQHGAITRKFYSKNEPPISIGAYLLRLHQFCPMSTAVYLATSLYIHRLAVEERAIPVTRRNAHRLVLAGLRVAMKALEDLSYPHGKIARVGGVSEAELARLEISFCFLAGFELVVGEEPLRMHWEALRSGKAKEVLSDMGDMRGLRIGRRPRQPVAEG